MLYNQIRSSNMNQHHAGERLNLFIQSLEISKKEFTRKTGLDYAHLYKITNGTNDPGFDTCSKINNAYPELSLTWLITGSGEMKNITREERNDIQRVREWRERNSLDVSAILSLFTSEYSERKSLSSELRKKRVYDEQVISRLKGILLELHMERRELSSEIYEKFKNDYSAEKDFNDLTEEEILEEIHLSPELKELESYIASFCVLGGKSQSQEIITEHFKKGK